MLVFNWKIICLNMFYGIYLWYKRCAAELFHSTSPSIVYLSFPVIFPTRLVVVMVHLTEIGSLNAKELEETIGSNVRAGEFFLMCSSIN